MRNRPKRIATCLTQPPESAIDGDDLLKMSSIELKEMLAYFLEGKTAGG